MLEIIPGTYIDVRDEALITAGAVISGNIGIVGTADKGTAEKVEILGSFSEAKEIFGNKMEEYTLLKALKQIYNNGGRTVYAVKAGSESDTDYEKGLEKLSNEIINIVLLAGIDVLNTTLVTGLISHVDNTAMIKRERIAVIGCNGQDDAKTVAEHVPNNKRIVYVAPGIKIEDEKLSGAYTAAAVAGLLSSLPVQSSPTNKTLNIPGLSKEYTYSNLKVLVNNRVLAVEKRSGYRVVKGITTDDGAWKQITTRRIVDYAIYGVRSSCNPYIGKLNNERVRGAMKATLDAFLTRMIDDEALVSYVLEVTATREQEIAGICSVTMHLKPTFSIDFIKVTMYLG